MSVWTWFGLGVGASLALSLVLTVVVAQILRAVATEASQLFEDDWWRSAPLAREGARVRIATASPGPGSSSQAAR